MILVRYNKMNRSKQFIQKFQESDAEFMAFSHEEALLKQRLEKAKKRGDPHAIRQAQAEYDKHMAKMKAKGYTK